MKRKLIQKLVLWKSSKNRMPLILYGARQVGKTYILKEFGTKNFRKMFYLNFEEKPDELIALFNSTLSSKDIVRRIEILFDETIDKIHDIVIFDEIQLCPQALTSLKYFAENMPELAVCCAGSHLGLMLNTNSFPVGKVDMLHLFPLDFDEFLDETNPRLAEAFFAIKDFSKIDNFLHKQLWESLTHYYMTGGLPAAVVRFVEKKGSLQEAFTEVRKVQQTLINGYTSDFAKHAGKENATHIHRVFENIPQQLSREIDSSAKKYTFKGVIPDKAKYGALAGPIDWLIKAGLAIKVPILETPSLPLKAYIKENVFKLYLFDTGILGAMLDIPMRALANQDYGSYKGFFAENFVAQEFIASGELQLYSWVHRTSEIEFLRMIDDTVIPIEVKSGLQTRAKSLAVFAGRYSPSRMIRLSGIPYRKGHLITDYPLYCAGRIGQK